MQGLSTGSQCGDLVGSFGPRSSKAPARKARGAAERKGPGVKKGRGGSGGQTPGEAAADASGARSEPEGEAAERAGASDTTEHRPRKASSSPSRGELAADVTTATPTNPAPAAEAAPQPRKRGRPKGSKNKPKPPKEEAAVLASEAPANLAALAALAGARAAAGSGAASSSQGTPRAGLEAGPARGFVSLDRPERCGTCSACRQGAGPCETLSALRALVSTPQASALKGRGSLERADTQASSEAPVAAARGRKRATGQAQAYATPPARATPSDADDWTAAQVSALKSAWLDLDPKAPNFWAAVAARVGRSAAECSQRWYDSCPTPGPPAGRAAEAKPAARAPRLRAAGAAPTKSFVQRVAKIARREARWDSAAAAAERAGDDGALLAVEEKRATQAATDRYIDQILRKRGGRAWGALLEGRGGGSGLIAAAVAPSADASRARLAAEDARREAQAALAAQTVAAESEDARTDEESDYYWSDA